MKEYYLDANAHLPMGKKALEEFCRVQNDSAGRGHASSPSFPGRKAAETIERARGRIAELLGAEKPSNIIFTNSCTNSCEWGMQLYLDEDKVKNIGINALEHTAVKEAYRKTVDVMLATGQELLEYSIPTDLSGYLFPTKTYDRAIAHLVHHETGVIQDLSKFGSSLLFSDMCQAVGKVPINLKEIPNLEVGVFGGHKFGGSSGIGFFYLRDLNRYEAFGTGSRYFLDRPGTPDVAGIAATAVALEEALETAPERKERQIAFRDTLEPALEEMGFQIVCKDSNRVPSTTFAILPNKALEFLFSCEKKGVYFGLGSACGAVNVGKNPSLETMGYDASQHSAVRISQWGQYNGKDAEDIVKAMREVMNGK